MSESDQIIGTVKGPGELPHEYLLVTTDDSMVRVGEFVYYEARDGELIRRIVGNVKGRSLLRSLPDAFLSDPETPPREIASMIGLDAGTPEIYQIEVETIGYFSERLKDFVNPRIPPRPGDSCYLASSETLSQMLSPRTAGEAGSAHIGSLLTRPEDEVPVVLSVRDVVSTHLAILASTGSGKSYTAGVLIEELMQGFNRAAVLIVDPHGEYHTLQALNSDERFRTKDGYAPEVKIFTPDKIRVRFSSLTEADVKYLLPEGTSDLMRHILSQAFRALINDPKRKKGLYGYFDLRDKVLAQKYEGDGERTGNAPSVDGLIWRLDSRFDRRGGIFHDSDHIPLQELFKPGRCTVLELSDIEQAEQQVIVGTLLRRVNKARVLTVRGEAKGGEDLLDYPVFTLLEEAHRFAPAGASVVSTNILKQILSEGRKFGVGVGLITQRPGKLDQDVLSQCMTQIIMRIVNPIDQQTIAQTVEGAGRAMLAELPALTKGQAVISGVGVNTPLMCRIRPRLTQHGGETFDAPAEWAKWHSPEASARREEDSALYLKESSKKKSEKIGGIKI